MQMWFPFPEWLRYPLFLVVFHTVWISVFYLNAVTTGDGAGLFIYILLCPFPAFTFILMDMLNVPYLWPPLGVLICGGLLWFIVGLILQGVLKLIIRIMSRKTEAGE